MQARKLLSIWLVSMTCTRFIDILVFVRSLLSDQSASNRVCQFAKCDGAVEEIQTRHGEPILAYLQGLVINLSVSMQISKSKTVFLTLFISNIK